MRELLAMCAYSASARGEANVTFSTIAAIAAASTASFYVRCCAAKREILRRFECFVLVRCAVAGSTNERNTQDDAMQFVLRAVLKFQ